MRWESRTMAGEGVGRVGEGAGGPIPVGGWGCKASGLEEAVGKSLAVLNALCQNPGIGTVLWLP